MRVGDDEFHTGQAAVFEARKERRPEHDVLGVADVDTEDLTAPSALTPIAITTARKTT